MHGLYVAVVRLLPCASLCDVYYALLRRVHDKEAFVALSRSEMSLQAQYQMMDSRSQILRDDRDDEVSCPEGRAEWRASCLCPARLAPHVCRTSHSYILIATFCLLRRGQRHAIVTVLEISEGPIVEAIKILQHHEHALHER